MADEKTGGSAFPTQKLRANGDDGCGMYAFEQGMTLRDYFAAKAMQSFLIGCNDIENNYDPRGIAIMAYEMADAMLEARKS